VDRRALADFLRSRRGRIAPDEAGFPVARRRTPGLRREEVASLAHISCEHYTRLEQARGSRPSRQVLSGLARALRLSDVEREHLFDLAAEPLERPDEVSTDLPAHVTQLLERLPGTAVLVFDARFDVIAWNPLAAALLEDFSALAPRSRNMLRRYFLTPDPATRHYGLSHGDDFARYAVARLRSALVRYPDDRPLRTLLRELRAGSAEFVERWERDDEVVVTRHLTKTVQHAVVGRLELDCSVLLVPDRDQEVVLFTAPEGSAAAESMELLAVVGTQFSGVRAGR
jgi:transcriptional regulator with XRE-family HTH domain